jgi:hypothetical protein
LAFRLQFHQRLFHDRSTLQQRRRQ